MAAGVEGAGIDRSIGVNIRLPFEQDPSPLLAEDPKLVEMKYFFTRKLMLMKESAGFAVLPGGFGTLDEAFELLTLLQTGKAAPAPVVLLDVPGGTYWKSWGRFVTDELATRGVIDPDDHSFYLITDNVEAASAEIRGFYRNYHSIRYVGDTLVIRIRRAPAPARLERTRQRRGPQPPVPRGRGPVAGRHADVECRRRRRPHGRQRPSPPARRPQGSLAADRRRVPRSPRWRRLPSPRHLGRRRALRSHPRHDEAGGDLDPYRRRGRRPWDRAAADRPSRARRPPGLAHPPLRLLPSRARALRPGRLRLARAHGHRVAIHARSAAANGARRRRRGAVSSGRPPGRPRPDKHHRHRPRRGRRPR